MTIDVLGHVDNEKMAFSEIVRVLKPAGFFLFTVPLKEKEFSELDHLVGHKRRYETKDLMTIIAKNKLKITKWHSPDFRYRWIKLCQKKPFLWKILLGIYRSKKSFSYFGLPKFLVKSLVRFTAFINRLSAPSWQNEIGLLKKIDGDGITLLFRKVVLIYY